VIQNKKALVMDNRKEIVTRQSQEKEQEQQEVFSAINNSKFVINIFKYFYCVVIARTF
jgi:hypothetical protein